MNAAGYLAAALAAVAASAASVGVTIAVTHDSGPRWDCSAEDEVVIVGDECVHIDTLRGEATR